MSALYKIKLQNFEGPLDLLLFFVRKDELNIYDIPLARITKSYLEYLQLMQDLNLDIASEFILMAATLMRIKVKMMLPRDPVEEEEEDMMDPREELSRRLIEYRQFKEASKSLSELDEYWRQVYRRSYFNFDLLPQNEEEVIGLKDISFFDLLAAYKKALEKKPIPFFHNVERLNVTVEEQQKYIMNFFRDRNCYLFTELCEDMAKIEIVVTFLALLDLVKRTEIAIRQASIFDDIWIYRATEFKEEEIPEEERVDSEIQVLTGQIESEEFETLANDPASEDSESGAGSESDAIDDKVDEPTSESPSKTEIQVEFVQNEIKTVDVTEDRTSPEIQRSDSNAGDTESLVSKNDTGNLEEERISVAIKANESDGKIIEHLATQHDAIFQEISTEKSELENIEKIVTDEPTSNAQEMPVVTGAQFEVSDVEAIEGKIVIEDHSVFETNITQKAETDHIIEKVNELNAVSEKPEADEVTSNKTALVENVVPNIKTTDEGKPKPVYESGAVESNTLPTNKASRWKNFLQKIVSMVRKIFS